VELLEWDEWSDVKSDKSLLRRKLIPSSDEYTKPQEFAKCKVSYIGKIFDTGIVFAQGENDEVTLQDDERFPQGFHDALADMGSGEKSEFKVAPFLAFGSKGNETLHVPPHAIISYTITLHAFQNPPDLYDMSTETHFSETEKFKGLGNEAFRAGQYSRAIKRYDQALKIIKHDDGFNDEEKKSAKVISCTLSSNLALTYYKQQDYSECLTKINEVLTDDPKNVKALVRRGQANMMLGNNDLAKDDFKQALQVEPENADVKKLMATNKKRIQEYKEKERKLYANMFGKPKTKTNPKTNPKPKTTASETTELKESESKEKEPVDSNEK